MFHIGGRGSVSCSKKKAQIMEPKQKWELGDYDEKLSLKNDNCGAHAIK